MSRNLTSQAQARVFWPRVNGDITETKEGCMECWHIAPSQACMPQAEPTAPFQVMAADYFDIRGTHHLVVVDRLVHGPTLLRYLQKPVISSEHWWPISSHLGSVSRSTLMVGQNLWLRRHRRFSATGVLNTGCYWHCIFVSVIIFYENIVLRIVCLLYGFVHKFIVTVLISTWAIVELTTGHKGMLVLPLLRKRRFRDWSRSSHFLWRHVWMRTLRPATS